MDHDHRQVGAEIEGHQQVEGGARQHRTDGAGEDAARRHPGDRPRPVGGRGQFDGGEAVHLQGRHRVAQQQPTGAHQQEGRGVEPERAQRGAGHAEDRADAKAEAAPASHHEGGRGKDEQHDAEMLQRRRQRRELALREEGDHRQGRDAQHDHVAGLADGLAGGQQHQVAPAFGAEARRLCGCRCHRHDRRDVVRSAEGWGPSQGPSCERRRGPPGPRARRTAPEQARHQHIGINDDLHAGGVRRGRISPPRRPPAWTSA